MFIFYYLHLLTLLYSTDIAPDEVATRHVCYFVTCDLKSLGYAPNEPWRSDSFELLTRKLTVNIEHHLHHHHCSRRRNCSENHVVMFWCINDKEVGPMPTLYTGVRLLTMSCFTIYCS